MKHSITQQQRDHTTMWALAELRDARAGTPAGMAALALSCHAHVLGVARVETVARASSALHVAVAADDLVVDARYDGFLSQQRDCLVLLLHDRLHTCSHLSLTNCDNRPINTRSRSSF